MNDRTLQALAFGFVATLIGACGSSAETPEATPMAGLGEPCAPASACASPLLCVDGECVERALPPDAEPRIPDAWVPIDIGGATDVGSAGDAGPDADGGTQPDGDGVTDVEGDVPIEPPPDGGADTATDGIGDGAGDVGSDVESDTDAGPTTQLILLKDDTVEVGAGDTFFVLNEGEAWVTQLTAPLDGDLLYAEVFLADVAAQKSCGRYRFAVWLPDESGAIPDEPTIIEPEDHLLVGGETGQMVDLKFQVTIPEGDFRIGLVQQGPCGPDTKEPALMSDASGVVDASWLWIPVDGTPPWVPASFFGVDGRWAIRAILEVQPPPDI